MNGGTDDDAGLAEFSVVFASPELEATVAGVPPSPADDSTGFGPANPAGF
jgi:hypothetical protein